MPFCPTCGVSIPNGFPACIVCGPLRSPEAAAAPETEQHAFAFTGNGHEYFRIWIVNLALSVVTLGVYSAWAKVRRLQYFHRNVRLAGAGFDYHGRPMAILKGRIIATILLGSYYLAAYLNPIAGLAAFVLLAAVMPWLFVRSLQFMLHNTSYRAIRFAFHGKTAESYWVMLGLPILLVPSLFLATPFWHHRLKRFQHANAAYGSTRFGFHAPVGAFYQAYLITALCFVVMLFLVMVVVIGAVVGTVAINPPVPGAPDSEPPLVLIVVFAAVYLIMITALWSLITAQIQNIVWCHTTLGRHVFGSTLKAHRLLGLILVNTLAMVGTLGLFKPYADIRLTRYLVSEMTLVSTGSLDDFVAGTSPEVGAVGDEALEIFDIDIAF